MFDPLKLKGRVSASNDADPKNVLALKKSLAEIGLLTPDPKDGFNGFVNRDLIGAVRKFQKSKKVREDGVVDPSGPTLGAVNTERRQRDVENFSNRRQGSLSIGPDRTTQQKINEARQRAEKRAFEQRTELNPELRKSEIEGRAQRGRKAKADRQELLNGVESQLHDVHEMSANQVREMKGRIRTARERGLIDESESKKFTNTIRGIRQTGVTPGNAKYFPTKKIAVAVEKAKKTADAIDLVAGIVGGGVSIADLTGNLNPAVRKVVRFAKSGGLGLIAGMSVDQAARRKRQDAGSMIRELERRAADGDKEAGKWAEEFDSDDRQK